MFSTNFRLSSSYDNYGISNSQQIDESILNHLFLPHGLSSSAKDDYLVQSNHQNEYKILECMNAYLQSLDKENELPILTILKTCTEHWLIIQNTTNCSVPLLQSTMQKLSPGDCLPLYFYAQNAAVLIEIDENSVNQTLISSWQVLLPTETITSSLEPHLSCFPVPTFRLPDQSQLLSSAHCELLLEFMKNTIEYSKSYKSSYSFDETREVPISHYVCQWWIKQFRGVHIDNQVNTSVSFKKKHRDQIRYKSSAFPFRRSGLWMTIKVVFQSILTKRLGNIGTIIYKLLITNFLTDFISTRQKIIKSPDLLIYCLRKIVRRLNKIEVLLSSIDSNDINPWIENIREETKQKIDRITPNLDWQKSIEKDQKQHMQKLQLNPNSQEIYQHSCQKLKDHLNKNHSSNSKRQLYDRYDYNHWTLTNAAHEDDELPRISALTNHGDDAMGIALARVEIWVQTCLEQWISRSLVSTNGYKCFENLQSFYEDYQCAALDFYYSNNQSTDPIGYSRFILTSLTIICLIHIKLCGDTRFERLRLHAIRIPHLMNLLEFLVLPNCDDMIRARNLYDYFLEFSEKPYPDLLRDIDSQDAFGVHFAEQSVEINENLQKIQEQVEQDKINKTEEINSAIEKYNELMKKVNDLKCECETTTIIYYRKCNRCTMEKEAQNIKVNIYECPIPTERRSALAVMFELQMPNEIRHYRDILWQFVNRPKPNPSNNMYEWLKSRPHQSKLGQYFKGSPNCKVKLVSTTKSITESHYSAPRPVMSTSMEEYFYEDIMKVQITPTKLNEFQDECRTLTPQLTDSNYKDLQFSIDNTEFVQNRVIAILTKCSLKLKSAEFVEFGSFRSGHRLQWWNLLSILELDSLSMDEESVVILITHALLQYGPVTTDRKSLIYSWCPESHQQLLEDHFVDELIMRLDRHLKDCECNWQNELMLVIITIIVMRVFTICNSTRKDQMTNLVLKCRRTSEKWIELISKTIQNSSSSDSDQMNALRDKIVIIGITNLLTYSIYTESINTLVLSKQDVISLLTIATTVHDNSILNKKAVSMSVFMRNLMRYSEYVLLSIHPIISKLLQESSYESLNEFCAIHWAVVRTKGAMNGKWKKRNTDIYDGWYDGEYESNKLSIDCLRGRFFVNKMTIGFLPDRITSDELFRRVFGQHIFEVQAAESEDSYITKHGYHADGQVHYEFIRDNGYYTSRGLVVYERHVITNDKFELIPPSCFETELPDTLVSNYSHWWNEARKILQFRPIHFQDSNFLNDTSYILELEKGLIKTCNTENKQYLINRSSSFFQNLLRQYFIRLDKEPYVYMLKENDIIHIHLSRLGIAFKYACQNNTITSREYSDMYIDEDQWFETLTGLKSGLLLSPIAVINQKNNHYLCRKLIVPFGHVQVIKNSNDNHQTVTIQRESSSFIHEYFVFILNDRLRILQPTDSPKGWLYLALLHAMTSHPLPDKYTGMTGMERSFQLLHTAGCWSDQPYDLITRNILLQIATISPKANFYPENLTCMVKIDWNENHLPHSMQHFGYYLIVKKLVETSEKWNFMHPSSAANDEIQKLFESKKYNEKLLAKLYWDYRDSYNPTARLSAQTEKEIRCTSSIKSYQPVWESCSHSTNYSPLRLVDHLYGSGNVDLKDSRELKCFPLSRWLKEEYQLKNVWIGLFKFIEQLKTVTNVGEKDEIERFEILLDFLHYISGKCSSQPFYLQVLRSILKAPTLTLGSVSYPSFTQYTNIQELSFQSYRINLGTMGHYKRNIVFKEIEDCFDKNCTYENNKFPEMRKLNNQTYHINMLLKSWRENGKLRSSVENIQHHLHFVTMVPLNIKMPVNPQRFEFELFEKHYRIHLNMTEKFVDEKLLKSAEENIFILIPIILLNQKCVFQS